MFIVTSVLAVFIGHAQDTYITNPARQMNLQTFFSPADKDIPLKTKYFIDSTATLKCEDLEEEDFRNCPQQFLPGFYKGVLWIMAEFPDTQATNGKKYSLSFGVCRFSMAEVLQYDSNTQKWVPIGRTGSAISNKFKSFHLSIPSVEIDESDFQEETTHKLMIRMISYTNSPVKLRLTPSIFFEKNQSVSAILNASFTTIIFTLIIIITALGFFLKDRLYLLIGFSTSFVFLFSTTVLSLTKAPGLFSKVLSPQHLANLINSLITTIIFSHVINELQNKKKFAALLYANLLIIGLSFIIALSGNDPKSVYIIVNCGIIIVSFLLILMWGLNLKFGKGSSITILTPWAISISIYLMIRVLDLIQKLTGKTLILADFDAFLVQNVTFVTMLTPVILITMNRYEKKIMVYDESFKKIKQQNLRLSENHDLRNNINKLILDTENKVYNTIKSSLQDLGHSDIPERILQSIDKNMSFIITEIIMETGKTPENTAINLEAIFNSCMENLSSVAGGRNITMKVRTENIENKFVYINFHVINFIFNSILSTTLTLCVKNSKLSVLIKLEDDLLRLKITTTTDAHLHRITAEGLEKEDSETLVGLSILKKILPYYSGSISVTDVSTGYEFSLHMKLLQSDEIPTLVIPKQIANTEFKASQQITDSLLTIDGQVPSIIVALGEATSKPLIESTLGKHCTLYTYDTGEMVWAQLQTAHALGTKMPDIIISDLNLPIMKGIDLLRKCNNEEYLKDIPFVFILPPNEKEKIRSLLALGAIDCIVHPYSIDRLYRSIHSIYSMSRKIKRSVISTVINSLSGTPQPLEPKAIPKTHYSQETSSQFTTAQNIIFTQGGLSAREQQIAALISEGHTDKEISERLNISIGTVTTHNKRIFKKLGVHSRIELVNKVR